MTITIRQKALANDNISLYLDIYDGGKRKFEFLSLYLLPEVDAETKARNEETLQRAHQIRAERILHPETIPEVGHFVFHLPAKANVDAALKRIAKKVGIEKNISFHCARHTFGILVQAVTGNIETTKKLMGHKSLKSTAIYADVLTNEKVKAVDNTKKAFRGRKQREENKQIPRTKRTAATNTHPRRITFIQDNK